MTASEAKQALEHSKTTEQTERLLQDKQRAMGLLEQQQAELAWRRRNIIAPDGRCSCSQRLSARVGECNVIVKFLEELKSFCQNYECLVILNILDDLKTFVVLNQTVM